MGPTILIVISILIATIIVLLSEKSMHRSLTDSPPTLPPKYRSSNREFPKDRNRGRFLEKDWMEDQFFDEPLRHKKRSKDNRESNRIIATIIFIAIMMGVLFMVAA